MRLLIVGQLRGQLSTATKMAHDKGAKVTHADTIDMAMECLRSGKGADLVMIEVLLDIRDFVNRLECERISIPVVACGIENNAKAAVAAIHAGAKEYIPLPPDADMIAAVLAAVSLETQSVVVADEAMQATLKLADQIARADASILITGESGTGKEVMARYIHSKSPRKDGAFIAVNCAAIPEHLLESELFGHEKGSFTGAVARRIGKFEEANGGTLLLDEVSEMDIRLQAKLLRAIQERVIDRLGGAKPVPVNIRIIATSNCNMMDAVKAGKFREDLFYRLNVVNLRLPALRERPKDIVALANHFAKKYAELNGLPLRPLTKGALDQLHTLSWPGNVREMENMIHRAVLLADGNEIDIDAIRTPEGTRVDQQWIGTPIDASANEAARRAEMATRTIVGQTVADVERQLILDTLDHCFGNRTHAANILGISIRTLRNKLHEYTAAGFQISATQEQRSRYA